jgi:hypothetical protein
MLSLNLKRCCFTYCLSPGVDERIISKWIFERVDGGHGLDQSGSG